MQVSRRIWQLLFLGAGVVLGRPAAAHSDEHLATVPAPHGGVLRMAGALHLELVLEAGSVRVYLTNHAFEPVSTAGATGSATVSGKAKAVKIPLRPAGGNLLSGEGRFDAGPGSGVKVQVKLPGQNAEIAEFPMPRANPAAETQSQGHEKH